MQAKNLLDVERVGGDQPFLAGIAPRALEPGDVFVAGDVGIFAVDALSGPVGDPVGRVAPETAWCRMCRAAESAARPGSFAATAQACDIGAHSVPRHRVASAAIAMGSSWRVGADGFEIVLVGEIGIGSAGEAVAQHVASWR